MTTEFGLGILLGLVGMAYLIYQMIKSNNTPK